MVAASVALGRKANRGVRIRADSARPTALKAPAAGVSAPASKIDDGPREAVGQQECAGEGCAEVRGAKGDQFLVGFDPLAPLGGQSLADQDGFNEADQGNSRDGRTQITQQSKVEGGQG